MSFIKPNSQSILQFLSEKNLNPVYQEETGQVYIVQKIANHEVLFFFGVHKGQTTLQIIAYFPWLIEKHMTAEIARLLHILNRDFDIPGFGMDEKEKLMFFRTVIPAIHGEIDRNLVEIYIKVTYAACEVFFQAIGLVASGKVSLEEVLKKRLSQPR